MRDYKFRGLPFNDIDFDFINEHISKNEFVYGNLIIDGNDCYIVRGVISCDEDNIQLERWILVRPETVGQYTGLKDKNGVEIYEGDILKFTHIKTEDEKTTTVKFSDGTFYNGDMFFNANMRIGFEVIGNIHTKEVNK